MVGSKGDIVNAPFMGLKETDTVPPSSVTFLIGDAQQVF
jgi:hypothetical protein